MDEQAISKPTGRYERLQALFEVFLLSGIVSGLLAALPFSFLAERGEDLLKNPRLVVASLLLEASITLVFLIAVLRTHRQSPKDIGLRASHWRADALFGILLIPLLFLLNILVSECIRVFLPDHFIESNPLTEIIQTPTDLALFIICAVVVGGVKEELQRAFIIMRFESHLGGAKLGLVLWSIAFGIGHYVQGLQGMLIAGLLGFVFGVAFLIRGRLIAPMVAHGLYNTMALLGYWFLST
jgi:membrane protease YdiL (CAAX protease family)